MTTSGALRKPTRNRRLREALHASSMRPPSGHIFMVMSTRGGAESGRDMAFGRTRYRRKREAHMALSLRDVRCDPIAHRALTELMHHYTVAEEKSGLVLPKKAGTMQLFVHDLDDLHQLDFVHNRKLVKEIERLRVRLATLEQQRESWKVRALMAEAQLLEAAAKTGDG